jgi:hypothetical protein
VPERVHGVALLAQNEMDQWTKVGWPEFAAREKALEVIYQLKPETDGLSEEQREELAEKEREYLRNPPI